MNLNASTAGETKIETIGLPLKSENQSLRPKLHLFYCTSELLTAFSPFLEAQLSLNGLTIRSFLTKTTCADLAHPAFLNERWLHQISQPRPIFISN